MFLHEVYLRLSYNGAASLLSGYKPHLTLLDWHNERLGRAGAKSPLPVMGRENKKKVVERKRKKERKKVSVCCLFKLDLSDQNFMQGCNWWYNVAL